MPKLFAVLLFVSGFGMFASAAYAWTASASPVVVGVLAFFGAAAELGGVIVLKGSDPKAEDDFQQRLAEAQRVQDVRKVEHVQQMLDENRKG